MNAEELTLNIAVNLGRLSRWGIEGKYSRIRQFIAETETYLQQLDDAPKNDRFLKTYQRFRGEFVNTIKLKSDSPDEAWAEAALTWANILQHRAKLA